MCWTSTRGYYSAKNWRCKGTSVLVLLSVCSAYSLPPITSQNIMLLLYIDWNNSFWSGKFICWLFVERMVQKWSRRRSQDKRVSGLIPESWPNVKSLSNHWNPHCLWLFRSKGYPSYPRRKIQLHYDDRFLRRKIYHRHQFYTTEFNVELSGIPDWVLNTATLHLSMILISKQKQNCSVSIIYYIPTGYLVLSLFRVSVSKSLSSCTYH